VQITPAILAWSRHRDG